MKDIIIRNPSRLFQHVCAVCRLGADMKSRNLLRRDMLRANLHRMHRGWSRLTNRLCGTRPVNVELKLKEPSFWYYPGSSDLLVLDQVFVDGEYDYPELNQERIEYIVDLGSNIGVTALFWAHRFPDAHIVCVEPDNKNFELLTRNVKSFRNRTQLFHAAAAHACEDVEFHHYDKNWSHSTVRRPDMRIRETSRIQGLTVNDICEQAGLPRIDLLKMDIEGAEARVMPTLTDWSCPPRYITIETHTPYGFQEFTRDVERAGYHALAPQETVPRRRMPLAVRQEGML